MKSIILTILSIALSTNLYSQTLTSPDGNLRLTLHNDYGLSFSVTDGDRLLLRDVVLDFVLATERTTVMVSKAKIVGRPSVRLVSEEVESPLYRQSQFSTRYNLAVVRLNCGVNIEFRLFDDGIAYRYVTTGIRGEYKVVTEEAEFALAGDFTTYLPLTTNPKKPEAMAFQATYNVAPVSRQSSLHAFLPVTIDCGSAKVTLLESDLEAYPGMFVRAEGTSLKATFAHYPKTFDYYQGRRQQYVTSVEDYIAQCRDNRTFPWRIIAIAHRDVDMPTNNLVYALASPNRIGDTNWIRPGRVAWDWWNDWGISGVDFDAGINFDTYKYYIDFASRFGIDYVILDEGWYTPSSGDMLSPIPDVRLPELVEYARQKGVKVILWCVFNCLDSNIDAICQHYSTMGIAGFKVDFLDRNDQTAVEMAYRIAERCAHYHMMLDFHGIYAPTGINRTYPNIVNFEAVFGMEEAKWTPHGGADMPLYDVTFPFVRGQAGYVDFTPGGFRNASAADFQPVNSNPMTMGTRCHQIAHYVVHESPLTMLADNPTIYQREEECTRYVTSLPTAYVSMKAIDGQIGRYVVMARSDAEGNWYVGGETSWEERDVTVDFSFLPPGTYRAEIVKDGKNANKVATDYTMETMDVDSSTRLPIHMASGGGFVIKLIK